jgi:hypothetical protein
MDADRQSRIWIDDAHAIFRRGIATCLTSIDLAVVGQRSEPCPQVLSERHSELKRR